MSRSWPSNLTCLHFNSGGKSRFHLSSPNEHFEFASPIRSLGFELGLAITGIQLVSLVHACPQLNRLSFSVLHLADVLQILLTRPKESPFRAVEVLKVTGDADMTQDSRSVVDLLADFGQFFPQLVKVEFDRAVVETVQLLNQSVLELLSEKLRSKAPGNPESGAISAGWVCGLNSTELCELSDL